QKRSHSWPLEIVAPGGNLGGPCRKIGPRYAKRTRKLRPKFARGSHETAGRNRSSPAWNQPPLNEENDVRLARRREESAGFHPAGRRRQQSKAVGTARQSSGAVLLSER